MKKILLTGAAIMALSLTAKAQTTVWGDNFDDEDITNWTLTDSDGDGNNWGVFQITDTETGENVTPVSLISRSWEAGIPLSPNNWAVSPAINLGPHTGQTITLSWLRQTNADFPQDTYTVYVGTSSDISSLVSSPVTLTEASIADGTPVTKTLDISSFAGNSAVYVAFRHYNSVNFDFVSIDNVTVVASGTAHVSDYFASKFSVSPNPASNLVAISNAENILIDIVSITDLNGRVVKTLSYDGVAQAQVNVSDLVSGVYMMIISSDKGTTTKKVVKN